MENEDVGSVAELWRFPVKSMTGEQLEEATFTDRGLVGDRGYGLIDAKTKKVVSGKSTRLFPGILNCQATYLEPPTLGQALPPVRISLADGSSVTSDSADIDQALSSFFNRPVSLSRAAPDNYTVDQYHPDIDHLNPEDHRNTVVEQPPWVGPFRRSGPAVTGTSRSLLRLVSDLADDDVNDRAPT